jgi:hypothetical protein
VQRIYVIPDLEMVVAITASMPENSQLKPLMRTMVFEHITAAVE